MKRVISVLMVLLTTLSFAQDKELFDFVNIYRVKNGVNKLSWSDELCEISKSQNKIITESDSLSHSHTHTYEVCVGGPNSATPITNKELISFNNFLSNYYKLQFSPENVGDSLNVFIKLHFVYKWSISPSHNKIILLPGLEYGSVDSFIGDLKLVDNKLKIGGQVIKSNKIIPNYKGKTYATFNLK
jgi:hypothetical protein